MQAKFRFGEEFGQSLVEFALTLPLLLILIAAVFDLSWAIYAQNTLADAAREGARRAIIWKKDSETWDDWRGKIRQRVRDASQGLDLSSDSQINISPSTPSHSQPITVTVSFTYTSLISLVIGGVSLPLSSAATMVVE